MPAVDCCVQLIHSIMRTVLWTKYLVTQAVPARYPAYPAGLFPVASGGRAGRRLSERAAPAGEAVTVFGRPRGAAARHVCLYPCSDDDYSSASLMTQGRREGR